MRSGRVSSQVAEAYVERDEHATLSLRGTGHNSVGVGKKVFVLCRGHIVVEDAQHPLKPAREVLVQLQVHDPTATFQMFSRESSAA